MFVEFFVVINSKIEAMPLIERAVLLQRGWASERKVWPLIESELPPREARPFKRGWASNREEGPITEGQGLSQRCKDSHKKAGPLRERQSL